jgi:hypothetical protein
VFEIDFDFIDHALLIRVSDGTERLPLQAVRSEFFTPG